MALVDYTPIKDDAFFAMLNTDVRAWLAEHDMDANTVPLDSAIRLDTESNEWVFAQWQRGEHGLITNGVGHPVSRVVRRAFRSLPPWVRREQAEVAEVLAEG